MLINQSWGGRRRRSFGPGNVIELARKDAKFMCGERASERERGWNEGWCVGGCGCVGENEREGDGREVETERGRENCRETGRERERERE